MPFAGENKLKTGTGFLWSSMERIRLSGSGGSKANWATAATMLGIDAGAPLRATPGFPNGVPVDHEPMEPLCKPFDAYIDIQSGTTAAEEKVTVNVQASFTGAALSSLRCTFDFSDGTRSDSCNPPAHTFVERGIHTITMTATHRCGSTVTRALDVEVLEPRKQEFRYLPPSCPPMDAQSAQGIIVQEFLPDPEGEDGDAEWIELKNAGPFHVRLCGIGLQVGSSSSLFSLDDVVLDPGSVRVLTRNTTGLPLSNKGGLVRLVLRSSEGLPHLVHEVGYPAAPVGLSWVRSEQGAYHWSYRPTPGGDAPAERPVSLRPMSPRIDTRGWVAEFGSRRILLEDTISKNHSIFYINQGSMNLSNTEVIRVLDAAGNLASVISARTEAQTFSERAFGVVEDVLDGRTLVISSPDAQRIFPQNKRLKSFRVHLLGVDPLSSYVDGDVAMRAEEFLRGLVLGNYVSVDFEGDSRESGYVHFGLRDVQAEMIASGLARVATVVFLRRPEYAALEEYARRRGAGVWRFQYE